MPRWQSNFNKNSVTAKLVNIPTLQVQQANANNQSITLNTFQSDLIHIKLIPN